MVRASYRKPLKIAPELLPERPIWPSRRSRLAAEIGHNEAKAKAFVKPGGTAIENNHRPGRSDAFGAFYFGLVVLRIGSLRNEF